jgi:single-strand DNA-binding protein
MIVYSGKVIKVEGNQIWLAFEKNANAPIRVSFSKEFEKKVEPGDQYLVSGELKNENEIFIYSYLDPVKISSDKDINNVFVVGRLGKDPEIKYFDDGNNVVNISLATNGVKQDPDWLFCEAWQKTAEIIANYCQKGSQIGFRGYLKSKKAANERIYHTVVGNKVLLLSSNNHETQKPEPEEEQEGLPF